MGGRSCDDYVLLREVASCALEIKMATTRGAEVTRIKNVLRRLGWKQRTSKDANGCRGYDRPGDNCRRSCRRNTRSPRGTALAEGRERGHPYESIDASATYAVRLSLLVAQQ